MKEWDSCAHNGIKLKLRSKAIQRTILHITLTNIEVAGQSHLLTKAWYEGMEFMRTQWYQIEAVIKGYPNNCVSWNPDK